jgi:hypothetical protein
LDPNLGEQEAQALEDRYSSEYSGDDSYGDYEYDTSFQNLQDDEDYI